MPTLPRQSASVAFRTQPYASGATPLPTRRILPSAPDAPGRYKPVPLSQPRHATQTRWLVALVIFAALVVSAGMVYLSGHAQVTQEGYRHTELVSMLRQAKEKQKQTQQMKALLYTQAHVEHKARALGMVPAETKQMVTVGETTPAEILQQSMLLMPEAGIRH